MKGKLTQQEKDLLKTDCYTLKHLKDSKADVGNEDILQKRCAQYLDYTNHIWAHIPNEAQRSFALAKHLQKQGLKAGIPDILIFDKLLAIELKANKNKPSQSQIEWLKALNSCGWIVCWVNGFDEFLDFLNANK